MKAIYYKNNKLVLPKFNDSLPNDCPCAIVEDNKFIYYNSLPLYNLYYYKVEGGTVVEKTPEEKATYTNEYLFVIKKK